MYHSGYSQARSYSASVWMHIISQGCISIVNSVWVLSSYVHVKKNQNENKTKAKQTKKKKEKFPDALSK